MSDDGLFHLLLCLCSGLLCHQNGLLDLLFALADNRLSAFDHTLDLFADINRQDRECRRLCCLFLFITAATAGTLVRNFSKQVFPSLFANLVNASFKVLVYSVQLILNTGNLFLYRIGEWWRRMSVVKLL